MTYMQSALALDRAPSRDDNFPASAPTITRPIRRAAIPAGPHTPSGRRLPDDLWAEYRLECQMRETLALPFVSLIEFADMHDWTDNEEETEDEHRENTTRDHSPYRPAVAYRQHRTGEPDARRAGDP